jgi:hypothetical protein
MDVRSRSPFDVTAALDILSRLSIEEDILWSEHDWPVKGADKVMLAPFDFGKFLQRRKPSYIGHGLIVRAEEEDADACEPCLYDPALFTSTATHPSSPLLHTFSHDSDRDKVSLVVFFFHATHLYAVLFESLYKLVHLFLYVFERAIGVFPAFVAQRREFPRL